jgi:hypothetical protein
MTAKDYGCTWCADIEFSSGANVAYVIGSTPGGETSWPLADGPKAGTKGCSARLSPQWIDVSAVT